MWSERSSNWDGLADIVATLSLKTRLIFWGCRIGSKPCLDEYGFSAVLVRIEGLVIGDPHQDLLFINGVACVAVYPGDAPALSIQRASVQEYDTTS